MYIFMYIHIYIYVYTYIYIHICICKYIYTRQISRGPHRNGCSTYIYIYAYAHVNIYIPAKSPAGGTTADVAARRSEAFFPTNALLVDTPDVLTTRDDSEIPSSQSGSPGPGGTRGAAVHEASRVSEKELYQNEHMQT